MVFAEATSVLPLIASDAYHTGNWKNRKKSFKISLMSNIKIAIIQMRMVSSRVKNLKNAINKIRLAHRCANNMSTELFLTNYFCQVEKHSNFKLAEKIPGPTSDIFLFFM